MAAARKKFTLVELIRQVDRADGEGNILLKEKFADAIVKKFNELSLNKAKYHTTYAQFGQDFATKIYEIKIDANLYLHREIVVKRLKNNLECVRDALGNSVGDFSDLVVAFQAKVAEIANGDEAIRSKASQANECKIDLKPKIPGAAVARKSAPAVVLSAMTKAASEAKKYAPASVPSDNKKVPVVAARLTPRMANQLAAKFKKPPAAVVAQPVAASVKGPKRSTF